MAAVHPLDVCTDETSRRTCQYYMKSVGLVCLRTDHVQRAVGVIGYPISFCLRTQSKLWRALAPTRFGHANKQSSQKNADIWLKNKDSKPAQQLAYEFALSEMSYCVSSLSEGDVLVGVS